MACTNCNDECNDCGCLHIVKEQCVTVQNDYTCLDVSKGDTLEDVLQNLNDIVCDLDPPSGITYVGTADEIDVTGNVISLSPTITTQINNIEAEVDALQACMTGATGVVKNITTTTPGLNILTTATSPCGRTMSINYTPGAVPATQKVGIIENLTTSTNINSLDFRTLDLSSYGLTVGDIIKLKGNLRRTLAQKSQQTFTITDAAGINTNIFASVGGLINGNAFNITDFEITLSVVSATPTVITVKANAYVKTLDGSVNTNFVVATPNIGVTSYFQGISTLALSNTTVRVVFTHSDGAVVMESFIAEIIRKI